MLLITANYAPEIGSSAQIYQDMASGFLKTGHEVHILTSYPRDYIRSDVEKDVEITLDTDENGVHVHRVKHPSNRDSKILRGLEHFYIPFYYFKRYKDIRKKYKIQFDACIHHIPPLPLYYLARWIKKYDGTPSILNIQDYHPQELTDVGFMKNPVPIAVLKHIEKTAYKKADYLAVNSPGGVEYVVSRGAYSSKVRVIFNPVSLDILDDPSIAGNFKDQEGISEKYLITYAGILSPFQGLDTILDTAKSFSEREDVVFYIVGDGMERDRLLKRVENEKISNVQIRKYLPRREYLNLIQSTDIALISLDERMKAPCLPGKTVNLMGLKRPILALVSEESETARVISSAKCGMVVSPNEVLEISQAIESILSDSSLRQKFGEAGRTYLMQNMASDVVIRQYETIIEQLQKK